MKRWLQRAGLTAGLALVAMGTAACFRPAGEANLPTQAIAITLSPDQTNVVDVNSRQASGEPGGSPTDPGIVLITATPLAGDLNPTAILERTTAPTIPAVQPTLPLTPTSRFITPRLPLGPVTPDTPVPGATVTSGQAAPANSTSTPSGLITPTGLPGLDDPCVYIVRPGDSPYAIAIANDVSLDDLITLNIEEMGDPPVIFPGDQLQIPGCGDNVLAPEATLTAIPTLQAFPNAVTQTPVTTVQATDSGTYVVQPGDTLSAIAQRFNTTVNAIVQANNLPNANSLQIGQSLIIPQ
jgi:LysM repeat protein